MFVSLLLKKNVCKEIKEKNDLKTKNEFFISVLDKSFILLLRISRCDGEIKAT